ncbi:MAG: hypothetical protein R2715_12295 [Ilumatobacteraceae bacterium]
MRRSAAPSGTRDPVFGDVEVVAVVTGRREAVVKVLNVSTADGFRMPSLDARVTISIAGDDNSRDFKKAVDRDGYAFVGRVETVLRTSVERIVRQRLGELSHRFLYGMAPADLFRDVLDVRLADGLLALHSMDEIVRVIRSSSRFATRSLGRPQR